MRLRISEPHVTAYCTDAVASCVRRGELTQNGGEVVNVFERELADLMNARHLVACSSGTTALHLALNVLKPQVVIAPALTYVATIAAAYYVGARVRFIDVDDTWTMNPNHLREILDEELGCSVAVLPVHLYGVCADLTRILSITRPRGVFVIEDAAQALFSQHHGEFAGTFGNMGTFSFYANKLITTGGEGGAVVTWDDAATDKLRFYRGQAQCPTKRYWHTDVGFNYRITAMQAAFGTAQLLTVKDVIRRRKVVGDVYRHAFTNVFDTQRVPEECTQVDWLYTLLVPHGVHRDDVIARLDAEFDIETRPAFPSVASMPPYRTLDPLPVTTDVAARGISLPTHAEMTIEDAQRVVAAFLTCVGA